jgi:arabinogalactan endo-1,4-beta-galactosidase
MTNETQKYNGWTNYETWLVNLHYDDFFSEQAQEAYEEAVKDDTFSREENATIALTDIIKDTVEEFTQEGITNANPFVTDLVNSALSSCNYYEIAKGYIENVDKEEQAA